MSNKRPVVLLAVLLVLTGGYVGKLYLDNASASGEARTLAGKNTITGLKVTRDANGFWFADMDYFFNGKTSATVCRWKFIAAAEPSGSELASLTKPVSDSETWWCAQPLQIGQHHLHFQIHRPVDGTSLTTRGIAVILMDRTRDAPVAHVAQQIDWPDAETEVLQRQLAEHTSGQSIAEAAREIDSGSDTAMSHAKAVLEAVTARDPSAGSAYVELARIAMKTNWGPEGLHQADTLLQSALKLNPDDVNAKIVMGYVETHQHRFKEAQALFSEVAKSDPPNMWLWANWAEMLAMQGHTSEAIEKYREALKRPPTNTSSDRARPDAYLHIMPLLEARGDVSSMEALYKQQASEYASTPCTSAAYARFELLTKGDPDAAIAIARPAVSGECDSGTSPRDILGLAMYVAWDKAPDTAAGEQALNQARIYLPAGTRAFYLLASDEHTLPSARRLVRMNEPVDARDNESATALAHALANHDLPTARRLLGLGAKPDAEVGTQHMPAAFIPVIGQDPDGIRLMQHSGVDYATLRFRGVTAVELARQQGSVELLKLLDKKGSAA
jgi:cytochrome c-type biogenesis protein CcmH/NrfG